MTMGMIELSLYVVDDNSPEIAALRPPSDASVSLSAQDVPVWFIHIPLLICTK